MQDLEPRPSETPEFNKPPDEDFVEAARVASTKAERENEYAIEQQPASISETGPISNEPAAINRDVQTEAYGTEQTRGQIHKDVLDLHGLDLSAVRIISTAAENPKGDMAELAAAEAEYFEYKKRRQETK